MKTRKRTRLVREPRQRQTKRLSHIARNYYTITPCKFPHRHAQWYKVSDSFLKSHDSSTVFTENKSVPFCNSGNQNESCERPKIQQTPNTYFHQEIERPSTDGKKKVVLRKEQEKVQGPENSEEKAQSTKEKCELELYSLSSNGTQYDLDKTIALPIYTSRLYSANFASNEVFLFTSDPDTGCKIHILEEGSETFLEFAISEGSNLSQSLLKGWTFGFLEEEEEQNQWRQMSFVLDMMSDGQNRYIVHLYTNESTGSNSLDFYSLEKKRTVVSLAKTCGPLLYVIPSDRAIDTRSLQKRLVFQQRDEQKLFSCVIDFEQAQQRDNYPIDPNYPEVENDVKFIDSRPIYKANFSANNKSRPWEAAGRKGFILESHLRERPDELDMFVIAVEDSQNFDLLYEQQYDVRDREKVLREFALNAKTKIDEYLAGLREELLEAALKHLQEVFLKQSVEKRTAPSIESLITTALPTEKLDKLVFKASAKISLDETPKTSFSRIIGELQAVHTFKFIVLMSPSCARSCCQFMRDDQLQLFLLINSARSSRFIDRMKAEFHKAKKYQQEQDWSTLDALMQSFDGYFSDKDEPIEDKKNCLLIDSDPTENRILWRNLETQVLLDMGLLGDSEKQQILINNCSDYQLQELLPQLSEDQRRDFEIKLQLLRIDQPLRTMTEMESQASQSTTLEYNQVTYFQEVERPSSSGSQRVALKKFLKGMKSYQVSPDGELQKASEHQVQLEFYNLSQDKGAYYLEKTLPWSDLNTTKLYEAFWCNEEVFFFSKTIDENNSSNSTLSINIIRKDSNEVESHVISEGTGIASILSRADYCFGLRYGPQDMNHQNIQLLKDPEGNEYVLSPIWEGRVRRLSLYDIAAQKDIAYFQHTQPGLLYISDSTEHEESGLEKLYTFYTWDHRQSPFIYSVKLNLAEVRKRASPLVVDPFEKPDSIIKFEGEDPFDLQGDPDKKTQKWERGVQKGFIIQKLNPRKIFAVEFRGPTDMKQVYEADIDPSDTEPSVHDFLQEPNPPKLRHQKPLVTVDSPLIAFYPEGGSSSAFIGQLFFEPPSEEQADDQRQDEQLVNMMRLDFPGVIVACGKYPEYLEVQIDRKPHFRARSTCNFGFLVVNFEKKEAQIYELQLNDPFNGVSFNKKQNWSIAITSLESTKSYVMNLNARSSDSMDSNKSQYGEKSTDKSNDKSEVELRTQRPLFAAFDRRTSRGSQVLLRTNDDIMTVSKDSAQSCYQKDGVSRKLSLSFQPMVLGQRLLFIEQHEDDTDQRLYSVNSKDKRDKQLIHEQGEGRIVSFQKSGEHVCIIDSNQTLHKIKLSPHAHEKPLKKEVSLLMIPSQVFEDDSLLDVGISDNILTTREGMITIASGEIVDHAYSCWGNVDKLLHTDENLIVAADFHRLPCLKIKVHNNPGSRQIRLGDQKLKNAVISVHQVDFDLLLLQLKNHTFDKEMTSFKETQSWLLVRAEGSSESVPTELAAILDSEEEWQAQSYTSKFGRLTLVLTAKGDEKVTKIKKIELAQDCSIALEEVKSCPESDAEEKDIGVLSNSKGEIILVKNKEKSVEFMENKDEDKEVKFVAEADQKVATICVDQAPDVPREIHFYAFTNRYFCWITPQIEDKSIKIFDLSEEKTRLQFHIEQYLAISAELNYHLLACNPIDLLRQGFEIAPNQQSFESLGNFVEVWDTSNHMILLDLNLQSPAPKSELTETEKFTDVDRYVATGFRPKYCSESDTIFSLRETRLSNMIVRSESDSGGQRISIYKYFTWFDLSQLKALRNETRELTTFETPLIYASFNGINLVHQLSQNLAGLDSIEYHIDQLELNIQTVEDRENFETTLQRLNFGLLQRRFNFTSQEEKSSVSQNSKTQAEAEQKKEFSSYTAISANLDTPSFRDAMLRFASRIPQFSLLSHLTKQSSMKPVIRNPSEILKECLLECNTKTASTEQITMVQWPEKLQLYTHMQSTPIVLKKEIGDQILLDSKENYLCGKTDKVAKPTPVKVGILELQWFFRNRKTFVSFSTKLKEASTTFYKSELMACVMNEFWSDSQKKIFWKKLIPFAIYIVTTVFYMNSQLSDDDMGMLDGWTWERIATKVLGCISLSFLLNELWTEIKQFFILDEKLKYFLNAWNLIDVVGISLVLTFNIDTLAEREDISVENLRIIAAVATCTLFTKLYDWLRLFQDTSFYVLLVKLTVRDILPFMILVVITLLIFCIPMSMLNLNRADDQLLQDESFGFWLLDAVYDQYLMAIGDPEMADNYTNSNQTQLVLTCFFFAISYTQVVMLNMLIAIMANTFDNAMELQEVNTIRSRLQFLNDFSSLLEFESKHDREDVYMVVVKPVLEEKDEDSWLGSINAITDVTKKQIDAEQRRLFRKTEKQKVNIDRHFSSTKSEVQTIRATQNKLEADVSSLVTNQAKIETSIEGMKAQQFKIRDLIRQLADDQ